MNWLLLKNSLVVASTTTALAVSLGFIAGIFLCALRRNWAAFGIAAAVVTLAMPPFLVTNTWLHFFGPAGVWKEWLTFNLFSMEGTALVLALLLWPISLFAVWSSLQRLEVRILEADPAVRGWILLKDLIWPRVKSPALFGATVTFVLALNQFAVPAIFQVKVLPTEAWIRFSTNFDSLGAFKASASLILAPLILLWVWRSRAAPWPTLTRSVNPHLFRNRLGQGFFRCAGTVFLMLLVMSIVFPLSHIFLTTRTWTEAPAALAGARNALIYSLCYAAGAATLISGLTVFGVVSSRGQRAATSKGASLLWVPFLIPGILIGVVFLKVVNRPGLSALAESSAVVLIALTFRYFALGAFPLNHALTRVAPQLGDTARLDGLNVGQRFRHVIWPVISPVVAASWYVVFVVCLWDVETIILLYPPGGETLAIKIFNLLHYGHTTHVNTLCLLLLGVAITPIVAYRAWRVLRPRPRWAIVITPLLTMLLTGCGRATPPTYGKLDSRFFSTAVVIGSRGVGVGQFNKPRSLATDGEENVYSTDMTGRVQKFSPMGSCLLSWQMPQTDLGKPKGMCRDQDGNVVVVEPHYQRINYFSVDGHLLKQWGRKGTNPGEFTLPRDVAVNAHGEAYVSEYGTNERIQIFDSSGKFLHAFGSAGTAPGEFNRPEGLCLDLQGRVYVADSCNHRIQVFSAKGKFLFSYGKPGEGKGELSYPYDICVDAEGFQFVCEFGNSRIQVFDPEGKPIEIIGGAGTAPGHFANPWAIALDDHGNLYVADSLNHRIQKLVRAEGHQLVGAK